MEFLVGIAIVALLLAILMPALQRVKEQARTIGCQANIKQWTLIFSMYAGDNDQKFPGWLDSPEPWPEQLKELWTLKWYREFDTTGPWTKAGGVQPRHWPEWMRSFKDYQRSQSAR